MGMRVWAYYNLAPKKLGSIEAFISELARSSNHADIQVRFVFPSAPEVPVKTLFNRNSVIYSVDKDLRKKENFFDVNIFHFLMALAENLVRREVDLITLNFFPSSYLLLIGIWIIRKLSGKQAFIWHEHSEVPFLGGHCRVLRRVLSKARLTSLVFDHFTTCSESDRQGFISRGGDPKLVSRIYNGVDLKLYKTILPDSGPSVTRKDALSRFTVITVSTLDDNKNTGSVIKSFAELLSFGCKGAKLTIVGDGPLREDLAKLACKLNVSKYVEFLGRRDDVPSLLCRSDAFMLLSRSESFGLAVVEAMASGLPVVTTAVGGLKEIVQHEIVGFTVDPDEWKKAASYLKMLYNDRDLAAKLGDNGRKRVAEHFQLSSMVKSYVSLYGKFGSEVRSVEKKLPQ